MDDLAALRLLVEWGADEVLADAPVNRFALPRPAGAAAPDLEPARPSLRPAVATLRPLIRGPGAASHAGALATAAATLDELHAALDGFEGCPLRATATNTVRPSGNPDSGLLLVADAPGAEDDRTGAAFSGLPGQMLDRVLGSIGLDRSGVLLTHLVPWRPPGSRAPNEAEVQACLPFLLRVLVLTRPRRILLVGAGPAKALAGATEGVRRLRGRWLPVQIEGEESPAQALALPPQDHWMRSAAGKRSLWADLLEFRQSIDQAR